MPIIVGITLQNRTHFFSNGEPNPRLGEPDWRTGVFFGRDNRHTRDKPINIAPRSSRVDLGFFDASIVGAAQPHLAAADGANNQEIAAKLKIPAVTVGKWRRLFAAHGIEGLRDAPRSGRPPKHDADVRRQVQTRVCQQPENQSRWSVRTLAAELGLPASTVHAMLDFHYTATHASWMNMIEYFFSILTKQALTHSVQRSKKDLKDLLLRYLEKYSLNPTPFTWTKGPEHFRRIIEATKEYQAAHPKKPTQRKVQANTIKKN